MQRVTVLVASAFFLAVALGACGSRGPLDDEIVGAHDAGVSDVGLVDQGAATTTDAAVDAGTGLIQCGTCVAQNCGTDVTTCLQDPTCSAVLQCVATTCFNLGGGGGEGGGGGVGGVDPSCLLGCTSGGGPGVGKALGIFQCITTDCGNACGGLLGGLGGLVGGSKVRSNVPSERRAIFVEAFSAWPELACEER